MFSLKLFVVFCCNGKQLHNDLPEKEHKYCFEGLNFLSEKKSNILHACYASVFIVFVMKIWNAIFPTKNILAHKF